MPDEIPKRPGFTHPLLYLWAVLLVIGTGLLGTIVAAGSWSEVREASVQPVAGPVDAEGKSLAIFADLLQPDREIDCTTTDTTSKKATPDAIKPVDLEPGITVDQDGSDWYLIALDTDSDGPVTISCAPKDGRSDNATYGYAVVGGFGAAKLGAGISIGGAIAGFALAAAVLWRRFQLNRHGPDALSGNMDA